MSGETEKQVSGWTVDTLKEYVESLRADDQKAVQAALQAAKEAVLKAEVATEKRFASVNEFRGQLADQTNTLMPRQEYTVQHKALEDKITELTDRVNRTEGQSAGSQITKGNLIAGISVAVTILGAIIVIANNVL